MDNRLLTLLQWCDSNFPSGAFTQSFGFETYLQEGRIHDKDSFKQWLLVYLHRQLVYSDGLVCRLIFEGLEQEDWQQVWLLDQLITVQNIPRESREGSKRMGERMLQLAVDLFSFPVLQLYQQRVGDKRSNGHPAIVYGLIAYSLEIQQNTAILSYLYSCMASLVQNGVRSIPLGQTDGQRLLQELKAPLMQALQQVERLQCSDLGVISPGLEIAQMRHERLDCRLFMS